MINRDLLQHPVWQPHELGCPIPDSQHAVSVALPCWQDVVAYEEKAPETMRRIRTGYPRFVVHPLVQEMGRALGGDQPCLPFPSATTAELAAQFVRASGAPARLVMQKGMCGVATDGEGLVSLRAFWQHTGLVVSSRQAEVWMAGAGEDADADAIRRALRRQLAALYDCAAEDVFLTPSGMASAFAALRAVQRRTPGCPTVQLGFPYVDTLKLQQKVGHGGHLLHDLDRAEPDLLELLPERKFAACFCEVPGNPLLGLADLKRITPILRRWGLPLVADDTVATPLNVDLSGHADLIATSLTKFITGTGDAMGGALICNPRSPYYGQLRAMIEADHEKLLWGAEARVLEAQVRGFPDRMRQHNANGLLVAEKLRRHPAIERVWYPRWVNTEAYEAVRRPGGGWGALITCLPRQAESRAARVYDALEVCKGPSLGTVFSLACPFTYLAHYCELEWARSCGVSPYLIRLSVGLEAPDDLWRRIERALDT